MAFFGNSLKMHAEHLLEIGWAAFVDSLLTDWLI